MNEKTKDTVRLAKCPASDIYSLRDLVGAVEILGDTGRYASFVLRAEYERMLRRLALEVRTYPRSGYESLMKVSRRPSEVPAEGRRGMTAFVFVDEAFFNWLADLDAAYDNLQYDNDAEGVTNGRYAYAMKTLRDKYDSLVRRYLLNDVMLYPDDAIACFEAAGVKDGDEKNGGAA